MTQIVSSISGIEIWAPSAGSASMAMYDKNSRDLSKCVDAQSASAIASAYQVVSATATQLYAGTSFLTSVNTAPISAARAGNAANAGMANSAYYDGTGRLISALPDSATVSAIASSYAKSSVSGVEATVSANSASWAGGGTALPIEGTYINISEDYGVEVSASDGQTTASYNSRGITISGLGDSAFTTIHHDAITLSDSADWVSFGHADVQKWNSAVDTVSANSASWGGGATGDYVEKSAIPLAIGTSLSAEGTSVAIGDLISSKVCSFAAGSSMTASGYAFAHGKECSAYAYALAQGLKCTAAANSIANGYSSWASDESLAVGNGARALSDALAVGGAVSAQKTSLAQGSSVTAYTGSFAQGRSSYASGFSVAQGASAKASATAMAIGIHVSAYDNMTAFGQWNATYDGNTATGSSAAFVIGDGTAATAKHDLMVITKDGEITMYSSTADTTGTGIMSAIRAISAAATGASVSLPITGSAGSESATYAATSVELVRNDTAGEPDIRSAHMSPDQFQINYTYNNQDYTSMLLNENMLEFDDADGVHVVDAYSIDSWNSAVDTVANNSASWGQGGVDSATVSSIASSYAESAVSGKLDTSAQVVTATGSASGVVPGVCITSVNGVHISAHTAYKASSAMYASLDGNGQSISACINTVSSNSASWGQGGIDSATCSAIASSYAESAVSSCWPLSSTANSVFTATGYGVKISAANENLTLGKTGPYAPMSVYFNYGGQPTANFQLNYSSVYGGNTAANTSYYYMLNRSGVSGRYYDGTAAQGWQYTKAEYDKLTATHDTVSANSASWGQGGVDSATVSAIASSYGDSAIAAATSYTDSEVSSRMYASAMQVVTSESLATATGVLYIVVY